MAKRTIPISKAVGEKLRKIAKQLGNARVEVGFVDGAKYPDGTSVASVAYWNNFGHGGPFPSPPRNFFTAMVSTEESTWAPKLIGLAKYYNFDGKKVMSALGEDIAGALQESIINTNSPALSDTTLALRAKFGNNPQNIRATDVREAQEAVADGTAKLAGGTQAKPLVWTGFMLSRVSYSVNAGPAQYPKKGGK